MPYHYSVHRFSTTVISVVITIVVSLASVNAITGAKRRATAGSCYCRRWGQQYNCRSNNLVSIPIHCRAYRKDQND